MGCNIIIYPADRLSQSTVEIILYVVVTSTHHLPGYASPLVSVNCL